MYILFTFFSNTGQVTCLQHKEALADLLRNFFWDFLNQRESPKLTARET